MVFPIESMLGDVVEYKLADGKIHTVRLVDGEVEFNQPGISCGFIHFANPADPSICLGFAGVTVVYDVLRGK